MLSLPKNLPIIEWIRSHLPAAVFGAVHEKKQEDKAKMKHKNKIINLDRISSRGWSAGRRLFRIIPVVAVMLILSASLFAVDDIPRWGVGLRISGFGVPNFLLDKFAYEHPTLSGYAASFEVRSYGVKGPRSAIGALFSLEYSNMSGKGFWRENEDNRQLDVEGGLSQVNLTATVLIGIFPGFVVHPYIGFGLGVGRAYIWSEGFHTDEDPDLAVKETYVKSLIVPVVHIPIGIMINISNKVEVRIEIGFKNGIYLGGGAVYNF
jgi:hypothetical protein